MLAVKATLVDSEGNGPLETRRFTLPSSLPELRATICNLFFNDRTNDLFSLSTLDTDGRHQNISSDVDFQTLCQARSGSQTLRLWVNRAAVESRATSSPGSELPDSGQSTQFSSQPLLSAKTSYVSFSLNGEKIEVFNPHPRMTVAQFLRSRPGFTGTKLSCQEGGCGACVILHSHTDSFTGQVHHRPINSCLCPLASLHNSSITTIEGLNKKGQPNSIQKSVIHHHGTQCGFCTPGFVMSMYALLKKTPSSQVLTADEIQDQFDGNICRCTGYRPILDAMQSFASEATRSGMHDSPSLPQPNQANALSLHPEEICLETDSKRLGNEEEMKCSAIVAFKSVAKDCIWYQPSSLQDLYGLIAANVERRVKLVLGNTSSGIFKNEHFDVFIGLHHIRELKSILTTPQGITFGSAVVIQDVIDTLERLNCPTLCSLLDHLRLVASHPVRNAASWAGNIAMVCNHPNFQSDVFTVFVAAKARLRLAKIETDGTVLEQVVDCIDILKVDMSRSVILDVLLPLELSTCRADGINDIVKTFKVMPRPQNAHAILNAGFRVSVNGALLVQEQPIFVFGGARDLPARATLTEQFVVGKSLQSEDVFRDALEILQQEMVPNDEQGKVDYRKGLIASLFYKFVLSLQSDLPSDLQSGASRYKRPIAKGCQVYSSDEATFPVSKPVEKLEAPAQSSGDAMYTDDIAIPANCLFAAFVTSKQANADIVSIDTSAAVKAPGVVTVLTAADIPGSNDWSMPGATDPEEILASKHVYYFGQAVALVIARSQREADEAARSDLVKITYTQDKRDPIVSIEDAVSKQSFHPVTLPRVQAGNVDSGFESSSKIITGTASIPHQYHFHLETQTCMTVPTENDEFTIYSATQSAKATQATAARALGSQAAKFTVNVKRLGGAYGGKIDRCLAVSTAVTIAAAVLRAPVKCRLTLDTNMEMLGKRPAYTFTYKVGTDSAGKLQAVELRMLADGGWNPNGWGDCDLALRAFDNAYHCPNWLVEAQLCKTDLPTSTYARSPGYVAGIFIAEVMLDHVARELNILPDVAREINFYREGQVTPYGQTLHYCNLDRIFAELKSKSCFDARRDEVAEYNAQNKWTKRGIYLTPVKYGLAYGGTPYSAQVNIFGADGSIQLTHAGIECGQGINTKVAQAAAYRLSSELGIEVPLDKIVVIGTSTLTTPNSATTGGSITSELNCVAAMNACSELAGRMAPVIAGLSPPPATWAAAVAACDAAGVQLYHSCWVNPQTREPFKYISYGAACTEVLVDVLTGESHVLRSDILFDCGVSINPAVDVGQVEGAFVMGLGYFLHESLDFDAATGALRTRNTWTYKPPCSKSWPAVLNVELWAGAPNPLGVLRSKASGEPPLLLACGALLAAKEAVAAARRALRGDAGPFRLDAPATPERLMLACGATPDQLNLR